EIPTVEQRGDPCQRAVAQLTNAGTDGELSQPALFFETCGHGRLEGPHSRRGIGDRLVANSVEEESRFYLVAGASFDPKRRVRNLFAYERHAVELVVHATIARCYVDFFVVAEHVVVECLDAVAEAIARPISKRRQHPSGARVVVENVLRMLNQVITVDQYGRATQGQCD